jgi:hypothetical protein
VAGRCLSLLGRAKVDGSATGRCSFLFFEFELEAVEASSITVTSWKPLVAEEGAFENAEEDGGEALEDDGVEEDELDEEPDEEAEIATGECLKKLKIVPD